MIQDNTLNVKFPNSQLNKLNSGIKSSVGVNLNLSSNVIGDFDIRLIFHINYYQIIHSFWESIWKWFIS